MKKYIIVFFISTLLSLGAKEIKVAYYGGTMSEISKKDLLIATNIWIEEMAKDVGYGAKSTVYDTPEELMKAFEENKVDYVASSGLDFVEHFDLSKLSDGFMKGHEDGSTETFVIVVKKDSNIKNVVDLQSKRVAMQKNDKIMNLYIENNILDNNLEYDVVYEVHSTRQRAILQLFFDKVDAAIVTNKSFKLFSEMNPQIKKTIKILKATSLQATNFGFIRKSLDEKTRNIMNIRAVSLDKDDRGKQLLSLYKVEIVVESKLEDLGPTRNVYEKNMKLKKRKNKK